MTGANESYAAWHQRKGAAGVEEHLEGRMTVTRKMIAAGMEKRAEVRDRYCWKESDMVREIYEAMRALDPALAAATGTAKTPKAVECEASQSGAAKTAQRPTSSTQSGVR